MHRTQRYWLRTLSVAFVLQHGVLHTQTQPAISVEPDVRIIQSDSRGLLFEFSPRFRTERIITPGGRELLLVTFDGAVPPMDPGLPDLRSRLLAVALPGESGNSVEMAGGDFEEIPDAALAPVPEQRDEKGIPIAVAYRTDGEMYTRSAINPSRLVELLPPDRVRSVLVGRVRISPVQYDASRRVVRRYSRLVIRVTFGPAGDAGSLDDPLVRAGVLNGETLKSWKAAPALRKTTAIVPSVLATGDWYRITVTGEGIQRIDAAMLSGGGVNLSQVNPRTIKIYGNGGREVPEDPAAPRITDLAENAIAVIGEGDGRFDQGDYILFFGRTTRGVRYDSVGRTLRHYIHSYGETNYYWLTYGGTVDGKRITDRLPSPLTADMITETFTDLVTVEEEKVNLLSSGRQWYGQSLSGPSGSFTHVNSLPDVVPDATILYRYSLVAHSDVSPTFTIREGSTVIGTHTLPASYGYNYATAGTFQRSGSSTLSDNTSRLNIGISGTAASEGWIDWIEILYPRRLWAVGGSLRFRSPDTTAVVEYRLQQFSSTPVIWDVTVPDDIRSISGISGSYVFRSEETRGRVREYCAAVSTGWKTPSAFTRVPNQDIRGYTGGADFIIVTSAEFLSAAERLRAHREQTRYGGLNTYVVDVAKIYNEFGGGIPDVSAIRDFLKYTYDNWNPRPRFVLLLGGASYDYKGLLGNRSTYVPTWQSIESRDEIYSYSTDDFFGKLGGGISLVLGRISSRTTAEANTVVDKIIRYDTQSARDPWKLRMLIVGDDAFTSEGGEVGDGTLHSDDQETLSSTAYTPDEFEKKKIYIAEYPAVNTGAGRRKPTVNTAIVDQVNQGVLIFNYAGHGRADLLAHERIFEVQNDVPALTNANKLAVWYLATCGFSQFDDPKAYTGSEFLMNKQDGGAVAVVSATRKVYAGANAALNQGTYRRMFTRGTDNRLVVERPATALFLYKVATGDFDPNDQKFCFMGDPSMTLQYPSAYATIDSIDGQPVDTVVQVRSLERVTVTGTLRTADNSPDQAFDGRATLMMNDATRQQIIANFYPGHNWDYLATGGTIYRGDNTVRSGRFSATFVVPKDVAYADATATGRMTAYFSGPDFDGAAYTGKIRIAGADSTALPDQTGPQIGLYLNSTDFRPGDMVSEDPLLIAELSDSGGINTSGAGIGHRIEAWLNGSTQSRDLTEFYASTLDDYSKGSVRVPLKDLPLGRNTLKLRAWDSYNNSATAETDFTIASSEGLTIADVLNFPNPMNGSTYFTFRQNQSLPLNVTVKVFTVAGRLIHTIDWMTNGEPYVRIPWDGRDREGDVLANGVYLYKVVARTADGRFSSEAIGKLSVLK